MGAGPHGSFALFILELASIFKIDEYPSGEYYYP